VDPEFREAPSGRFTFHLAVPRMPTDDSLQLYQEAQPMATLIPVVPNPIGGVPTQTARDSMSIQRRIAIAGPLFATVSHRIRGIRKSELLADALTLSTGANLTPPDRICRRSRDALVCWFCMNAPNYQAGRDDSDESA
jgi:hypothetical protein